MNLLTPTPREEPPIAEPLPSEPPEPPYMTGGAPFPVYPTDDGKYGISILDYFAAHVMAGLCARTDNSIDNLKENGPKDAYWIAAMMVQLRNELPIVSTPPPPEPIEPEEEVVITAAEAVYKIGNRPPPPEYAPLAKTAP